MQPQGQPQGMPQSPQEIDPQIMQAVQQYIAAAMKLIHGEQTRDRVLQVVQSAPNPIVGAAQAGLVVLQRIEKEIPADDTVLLSAGNIILGEIMTVAEAAGLHQYSEQDRVQVFQQAVKMFVGKEVASGKRDPQQIAQQLQELQAMQGGVGEPTR
jgi:hypothetical protein